VLDGGHFEVLGQRIGILGLHRSARVLDELRSQAPEGPKWRSLERVVRFTNLARNNLGTVVPLLARLTRPIAIDKEVVNASTPPLEAFAIAVAATLTWPSSPSCSSPDRWRWSARRTPIRGSSAGSSRRGRSWARRCCSGR
jgi:hypothetical protein